MPGLFRSLKKKTAITQNFRRGDFPQISELRMLLSEESSCVREYGSLSTPVRIPISFSVEVEDVRSDLAARIDVRRKGKAARAEVPVHRQFNSFTRREAD